MTSSRVVLSPWGWSWIAGGLGGLLIGLLTLNLLLLILPAAALVFVAAELISFDRATRDFGMEWFRWQRFENSSQVPLDSVGSMAIDVELAVRRSFYVELFDSPPSSFEIVEGSPRLLTWWEHDDPVRLAYVFRPRERGQFRLGPTVIVAHQPLGLACRITRLENRWEVVVTPSLTVEAARSAIASGPRGPGETFRRRTGPGTEFRTLHEYDPSDDVRRIVWRRSAIDKMYVREHEEEVHPDLLIVVDCGRDMRLGPPGSESLELSVDGATVLAGTALARADRVGLLVFSSEVEGYQPVSGGPRTAAELTEALGRVTLSPKPFQLDAALDAATERLLVPSTIVVFSNLASAPGETGAAIAGVRARGHRIIILCPEYATLYPPLSDATSEDALDFVREPERLRLEENVDRVRDAGAPVAVYPPSHVRDSIVEFYGSIRIGGMPA
jgi:uncharacterized protein (DUF58 family)